MYFNVVFVGIRRYSRVVELVTFIPLLVIIGLIVIRLIVVGIGSLTYGAYTVNIGVTEWACAVAYVAITALTGVGGLAWLCTGRLRCS